MNNRSMRLKKRTIVCLTKCKIKNLILLVQLEIAKDTYLTIVDKRCMQKLESLTEKEMHQVHRLLFKIIIIASNLE